MCISVINFKIFQNHISNRYLPMLVYATCLVLKYRRFHHSVCAMDFPNMTAAAPPANPTNAVAKETTAVTLA